MSVNIRYPNITGLSEKEQLAQIKSYLHQLVEQLNYALQTLGTVGEASTYEAQGGGVSYYELQSMIIDATNKLKNKYERLYNRLENDYVGNDEYQTLVDDLEALQGDHVSKEAFDAVVKDLETLEKSLPETYLATSEFEAYKESVSEAIAAVSVPAFYTELARFKNDAGIAILKVIAHGLTVGETYGVHLYTAARRRGRRHDPWRHPSNENTGTNYTGKGYANLVGQGLEGKIANGVYPAVPDWMPRGGILQTEWELTASAETETLEINLGTWLLPMLKPLEGSFDTCALIGVGSNTLAPLLMQWRLVKNGTVGECKDTFRVGLRLVEGDLGIPNVSSGSIDPKYLYTSIH